MKLSDVKKAIQREAVEETNEAVRARYRALQAKADAEYRADLQYLHDAFLVRQANQRPWR